MLNSLKENGLIAQCSNYEKLDQLLTTQKLTLYCGFDPTSNSLTVGNLLALVFLKRFLKEGHRVIVLLGGATAQIGDPTGRNSSRPILSEEELKQNLQNIQSQIEYILGDKITIVNNVSFYETNPITFLKEIGSKFTVNSMLTKDSIKNRLESGGLTLAEMSYGLFQGYDFLKLAQKENCVLQIGGNDQWGNICDGIHLAATFNIEVFGLTFPLLLKSDGAKFGKSSEGNIWLDPTKTTPWNFYQFWINIEDSEIEKIFRMYNFTSSNINILIEAHKQNLEKRLLQTILAQEMTILVHDKTIAQNCFLTSQLLFHNTFDKVKDWQFEILAKTCGSVKQSSLIEMLLSSNLANSKSDARKLIENNAIKINNINAKNLNVSTITWYYQQFAILQKGKKDFRIIRKKQIF
jgi:tyrosyl-tRNA synthetase